MNIQNIFLFLFFYTFMYYKKHVYIPKIYTRNPVIKKLRICMIYPFYLLPFGFLQTIFQLMRRIEIKNCKKSTIRIEVGDEAVLSLDEYYDCGVSAVVGTIDASAINASTGDASTGDAAVSDANANNASANIDNESHAENILLVHGLNGSGKSTYIKGMANTFLKRNCRVFCFNARGVIFPPKSNIFSHIGLVSDLKITVEYILNTYKGHLSVIGFSLGSNWVAKLFAEYSHSRIRMGISICCPFDYCFLNSYFSTGILKKPIKYFMVNNYKRYIRKAVKDPQNLDSCWSVEQVDSVMAGALGISDINSFYRENSCVHSIESIKKPFLFINSQDDPIIPTAVIPFDACISNPNTGIVLLKGGHLGFFTNRNETMAEKISGDFYDLLCASD